MMGLARTLVLVSVSVSITVFDTIDIDMQHFFRGVYRYRRYQYHDCIDIGDIVYRCDAIDTIVSPIISHL